MREIEVRPNWKIVLRVWWSIYWRSLVWGLVGGSVMTLTLDFLGRESESVVLIATGVSAVFCICMEVWFIWHALTHNYGGFRLVVMKKESAED
jgi:hypothetical protein